MGSCRQFYLHRDIGGTGGLAYRDVFGIATSRLGGLSKGSFTALLATGSGCRSAECGLLQLSGVLEALMTVAVAR